jgi:hypothetical protein
MRSHIPYIGKRLLGIDRALYRTEISRSVAGLIKLPRYVEG